MFNKWRPWEQWQARNGQLCVTIHSFGCASDTKWLLVSILFFLWASKQKFWPISFRARSEVGHNAGFDLRPVRWYIWWNVFSRKSGAWMRTSLSLLGYNINLIWELEHIMCDLYYDSPVIDLFHRHERLQEGQTWCHWSRTFSILLDYGALNKRGLLREELSTSSWTSSAWN